jgi:hypothetical protein
MKEIGTSIRVNVGEVNLLGEKVNTTQTRVKG